jgi:Icc-related predicted phosphoesterase
VHESCATDKIGVTSVVNVGNINEGNACIIEISDEDEKPDIKIDLIEF